MHEKKILKATAWYTISSFLMKGIGLITIPIFTRLLTKSEYGSYSNFQAWLSIISIIATLSLIASLNRARFDFSENLESYILSNLILGSLSTIVVFSTILLNRRFFCNIFQMDTKYLLIMSGYLLVSPAYDMFLALQRYQYKYVITAILTVAIAVSSIGLSLLFIQVLEDHLWARVLGSTLPTILASIFIYFKFIFAGKKIHIVYWKYSLPICLPYIVHLLSGTVLNSSDRTMITNMCGNESNALYSLAYNIAMIVNIIWGAMNNAYSPWLGEKLNSKEYKEIYKTQYIYIGIYAIIIIGAMLVGPELLLIFGGKSYLEAINVIPPVVLGCFFIAIYTLYVNIEIYEKKTIGMACATVIAAFFNLVTNAYFIPKFGYIAAAYTTLIGYIILYLIHYWLVRKIGLHICYNSKFITLMVICMIIIMIIILILYQYDIARYILMGIYFGTLVFGVLKKRKFIRAVWRK